MVTSCPTSSGPAFWQAPDCGFECVGLVTAAHGNLSWRSFRVLVAWLHNCRRSALESPPSPLGYSHNEDPLTPGRQQIAIPWWSTSEQSERGTEMNQPRLLVAKDLHALTTEYAVERLGRVAVNLWVDLRVNIHRGCDLAMPKHLHCDASRHTCEREQGSRRMA